MATDPYALACSCCGTPVSGPSLHHRGLLLNREASTGSALVVEREALERAAERLAKASSVADREKRRVEHAAAEARVWVLEERLAHFAVIEREVYGGNKHAWRPAS